MDRLRRLTARIYFALAATSSMAADVVVNGIALDAPTRQSIERTYRTELMPGRYWYDSVSGVWGLEGGPSAGQIQAGLRLGGPLQHDASRGRTGVIVNGRELHALDLALLQRCVRAVPGRYWVLANGVGGYENAPPSFNLAVLCSGTSGGSSTRCENYGRGQFNCSNSRTGIGMIGEGGGKGGVFIDGEVYLTPNCAFRRIHVNPLLEFRHVCWAHGNRSAPSSGG